MVPDQRLARAVPGDPMSSLLSEVNYSETKKTKLSCPSVSEQFDRRLQAA